MAESRIYLTGHVAIEHGSTLIRERQLAGRQGRLAFVYLIANRHTPIARHELIDVIWPDDQPPELDAALAAILSKLRNAFKKAALDPAGIEVRTGSITVNLPSDTRVDIEEAANAVDEAEGALRIGDRVRAWGAANVGISVCRRPFLSHEGAPWIDMRRAKLRGLLTRALRCLGTVSAEQGELPLAVQYATEVIEVEPFGELGYQELMRLQMRMGNRAEALRVFGKCRELLREELGTSPSPQTEALYLDILRAGG